MFNGNNNFLINTKLIMPPIQSNILNRPALIAKLNEFSGKKLTLLCAPGGYGKTTLISMWLSQISSSYAAYAWLSLNEYNNEPQNFVNYLLASLERSKHPLADKITALRKEKQMTPEQIVIFLMNLFADQDQSLICVMDDYHAVENNNVHNTVKFMLDNLPPQIHIVIITRYTLPISLHNLRIRREVLELGVDDLKFSRSECESFLNSIIKTDLKQEHLQILDEKVEGWIAALHIAALSLKDSENLSKTIASFSSGHLHILEYFSHEFFNRLDKKKQLFLMKTSILEELNGDLCSFVASCEESQSILEELTSINLFTIPLDSFNSNYRYHHLFADFLQKQLEKNMPSIIPELYNKAGRWYEKKGSSTEAVEYYIKGKDYESAIRLFESIGKSMLAHGLFIRIMRWLDLLPEEYIRQSHEISMIKGWSSVIAGNTPVEDFGLTQSHITNNMSDYHSHTQLMMSIAALNQNKPDYANDNLLELMNGVNEDTNIKGISLILLSAAKAANGDFEAAENVFNQGKSLLSGADIIDLSIIPTYRLASVYDTKGFHSKSLEIYESIQSILRKHKSPLPPSVNMIYAHMSNIYYERNELPKAQSLLQEGLELIRQTEDISIGIPMQLMNFKIMAAKGIEDEAVAQLLDSLSKVKTLFADPRKDFVFNNIEFDIAKFLTTCGRFTDAFSIFGSGSFSKIETKDSLNVLKGLTEAILCYYSKQYNSALQILEKILLQTQNETYPDNHIEFLALYSLTLKAVGKNSAALRFIKQALLLTQSEHFVRTFIDYRAPMLELLQLLRGSELRTSKDSSILEYLDTLIQGLPISEDKAWVSDIDAAWETPVERLTPRELEVLKYIDLGLSNVEIAEKLFVSKITIKKHINNLYGKLSVSSRQEVLENAKRLKLI